MNWALSIVPMAIGQFLLRFGMVSRGRLREVIQFIGGITCLGSVIAAWLLLGWKAWFGFMAVYFFLITPMVEMVISKIDKKINEPYEEAHEYLAKKYNKTPE